MQLAQVTSFTEKNYICVQQPVHGEGNRKIFESDIPDVPAAYLSKATSRHPSVPLLLSLCLQSPYKVVTIQKI
jgi:hypothetical protein